MKKRRSFSKNILLIIIFIAIVTSGVAKSVEDLYYACKVEEHPYIYLSVGERYDLGDIGISQNKDVARTEGTFIIGKDSGTTVVKHGVCSYVHVIVTDLVSTPIMDNTKPFLPCGTYSEEENRLIDSFLQYRINKVGYQTRAAAVEAARFLTLRFRYKLNYFYENGRLSSTVPSYRIDGEGRYYHTGLYLSPYKYDELSKSSYYGPACWGCKIAGEKNGLDCSGFVSWILYNAGFDPGDIGAGPTEVYDYTDIGEKIRLRGALIDDIKVGDLIGFIGHIGIIIGDDGENVYVAEAFWTGDLNVEAYTYRQITSGNEWTYLMKMDSYYIEDGQLENYWE